LVATVNPDHTARAATDGGRCDEAQDDHQGKEYVLTGDEVFTVTEHVQIIAEAIGRDIEVREAATPAEAVRSRFPVSARMSVNPSVMASASAFGALLPTGPPRRETCSRACPGDHGRPSHFVAGGAVSTARRMGRLQHLDVVHQRPRPARAMLPTGLPVAEAPVEGHRLRLVGRRVQVHLPHIQVRRPLL
jgi:hypothetical protein